MEHTSPIFIITVQVRAWPPCCCWVWVRERNICSSSKECQDYCHEQRWRVNYVVVTVHPPRGLICVCHMPTNPWWPHGWVLSTVSCSAALLSPCTLRPVASFMEPVCLMSDLLFSCYLLYVPSLLSFPKNSAFSWCAWSKIALVFHFCLWLCFSLNFLKDPLVCLSGSTGYLVEVSPTLCFKWINFLPISLLHCPVFTSVHSNREHESVGDVNCCL